jgi:Mg2+/Co2+ transporter CorC
VETIGGLVIAALGRLARPGDVVSIGGRRSKSRAFAAAAFVRFWWMRRRRESVSQVPG